MRGGRVGLFGVLAVRRAANRREPLKRLKTQCGDGGRYRIRTYDFHRVKMALYR
jgi:hypothetical protein